MTTKSVRKALVARPVTAASMTRGRRAVLAAAPAPPVDDRRYRQPGSLKDPIRVLKSKS
jgi:hypothetical protein